jgi:quercetin dioxygenase-like cupin family protein
MKRMLYSLLVATLPFGSVLADAPKSKNVKVTLVYQHELPNVPGKTIKGVLVEYGPGGYSPWSHASQIRLHLQRLADYALPSP